MSRLFAAGCVAGLVLAAHTGAPTTRPIQFVFTSDAHYGITRPAFRGTAKASAHLVNSALVAAIKSLPAARFPADGGLHSGALVGSLDFVAEGGDVANREEGVGPSAIQPAAVSWAQFAADYIESLAVPVYVVPGNHEASNAVGFYKAMTPPTDVTPLVEMFNRMLLPGTPKTQGTFDYDRDRVLYARDIGGVHFVFLQVWPDSRGRAWMDGDLARLPPTTPVVIVVHDQPESQAKHFTNPNGTHAINAVDQFENLLSDTLADGSTADSPTTIEQTALEDFLLRHPYITAYFHGNSNWNEFYQWTGPHRRVTLNTFRVDSPMKGRYSADDERLLSFQVVTIDPAEFRMTVREYFWNQSSWGATATVPLAAPVTVQNR